MKDAQPRKIYLQIRDEEVQVQMYLGRIYYSSIGFQRANDTIARVACVPRQSQILPRGNEKCNSITSQQRRRERGERERGREGAGERERESSQRGSLLMQQLARVNARRSNSHFLSIAATIPPRKRPIIRRFITRGPVGRPIYTVDDEKGSRRRTSD